MDRFLGLNEANNGPKSGHKSGLKSDPKNCQSLLNLPPKERIGSLKQSALSQRLRERARGEEVTSLQQRLGRNAESIRKLQGLGAVEAHSQLYNLPT